MNTIRCNKKTVSFLRRKKLIFLLPFLILLLLLVSTAAVKAVRLTLGPYRNGTILLLKPLATGVGEGRYEPGDIVEIREADELYKRLGPDKPFFGRLERTTLLPVYYDGTLTDEMKRLLTEPETQNVIASEQTLPSLRGSAMDGHRVSIIHPSLQGSESDTHVIASERSERSNLNEEHK